jgi:tetratricopeptide (TPR) repeat protein
MATKRRVKKKSLKQDQLVTYSLKASKFAQDHFNHVLTGIIVLVLIIAGAIFITQSRKSAASTSEKYLGAALSLMRQGDVAAARTSFQDTFDRYSNTRAGAVALYFKAECDLTLKNFGEAKNEFDAYLERSDKFPEFRTAAVIGKAMALEGMNQLSEAAAVLDQLITQLNPKDPRYTASLYRAAIFHDKTGNSEKAVQYLQTIVDTGTGPYQEEAEVKLAALKAKYRG